jgi:hypothetical protein
VFEKKKESINYSEYDCLVDDLTENTKLNLGTELEVQHSLPRLLALNRTEWYTWVFISTEKYASEQALKTISQNDAHTTGGPGLTPTRESQIEHSSNSHK